MRLFEEGLRRRKLFVQAITFEASVSFFLSPSPSAVAFFAF